MIFSAMFGGLNPGSQTITATGAGSFTVPAYTKNLRVRMWGAGGGGVGHTGSVGFNGTSGGDTTFSAPTGTLTAGGGKRGATTFPTDADGGVASGGDVNENGQAGGIGGAGATSGGAAGGTAYGGGARAEGRSTNGNGNPSNPYGGGGGGCRTGAAQEWCGGGGGAFVEKVYTPGQLSAGSSVSYSVGAGGPGGNSSLYDGAAGANGAIQIDWDY